MFNSFTRYALVASSFLSYAVGQNVACNNSPSLCNRQYDNVTYLGAHDSPFLRNEGTSFSSSGNQYYSSSQQLSAGVRLLSAQVHKDTDDSSGQTQWKLCHSSCVLLDAGTLENWLSEIKTWMDNNQNEVVTLLLVNSDGATATDLNNEFQHSGIASYAYTPTGKDSTSQQWPTLATMINTNKRLVTFVASLSDNTGAPYLMDEFSYVFENNFVNTQLQDFNCLPSRPDDLANNTRSAAQSQRMFLQNHFLYQQQAFGIQVPDTTKTMTVNGVNGTGSLGQTMRNCATTYGKSANYVLTDYINVGPAIKSVDEANGVSTAIGRTNLPNAPLNENTFQGAAGSLRSHISFGMGSLLLTASAFWLLL